MKIKRLLFLGIILIGALSAFGQTEAGVTVYGALSNQPNILPTGITCVVQGCPSPATHVNSGVGVEGFLAHSIGNLQVAKFSLELPILAIPDRGTDLPGVSFSTLAVTPDLRVNVLPKASISPFLSGGGGIVHFGGDSRSGTKGAFALSGGVDLKTHLPLLAVRIQVKDLITPWPSPFPKSGAMNNVLVGGGLMLRF